MWQKDFNDQMNIHQLELKQIKDVFVDKIKTLEKDVVTNGKAALDTWLDEHWSDNINEVGQITSNYLNTNFNTDSNCLKWKLVFGFELSGKPANYEYKDMDLYYKKKGNQYIVLNFCDYLLIGYHFQEFSYFFDGNLFVINSDLHSHQVNVNETKNC